MFEHVIERYRVETGRLELRIWKQAFANIESRRTRRVYGARVRVNSFNGPSAPFHFKHKAAVSRANI